MANSIISITNDENSMSQVPSNDVEFIGDNNKEENINEILKRSYKINEEEKQLGVLEACRQYPRAIFWATIFSFGIVMAGYDAQIISGFYSLPAFQKHYGKKYGDGYEISAPWQTALGMGSPIGQVVGTLGGAYPLERFGRKKTFIACNIAVIGLVFMQMFAPSIGVLCAGEIIAGLVWGTCVLIGPTYASEVSPNSLRSILTSANNLSFVIGQFVATGVSDALANRADKWAYKIPFAVQWVWPVIILSFIYWAPESPYWLVRQNKTEEARDALRKLAWADSEEAIDNQLYLIQQTDALEKEMDQKVSYRDLFKGTNTRRTEITVMVYLIQVIGGNPLCLTYSTYFFEQAGFNASNAFNLSLGLMAIGFVGTCLSWPLLSWLGRRTIYNIGIVILTLILFLIGFLDLAPNYKSDPSFSYAQASLMLIWAFFYQLSEGPITFVIIGEVPSATLRGKSIALGTAVQALGAIATTVALPYLITPTEANLRGKTAFIFAGLSFVSCFWCYFRLPETKDRTFEEIDIMFHRVVPTREFGDYKIMESEIEITSDHEEVEQVVETVTEKS